MKWIAVAAGVLLVAILVFSNITGAVPKTSDTIEIEPEQIQEEIEETSEEVNEAAGRMVPDELQ